MPPSSEAKHKKHKHFHNNSFSNDVNANTYK